MRLARLEFGRLVRPAAHCRTQCPAHSVPHCPAQQSTDADTDASRLGAARRGRIRTASGCDRALPGAFTWSYPGGLVDFRGFPWTRVHFSFWVLRFCGLWTVSVRLLAR